jgi:hypothetical protein
MGGLKRYIPFFSSALLMWVVLYIIYPHYQYYIDPDGTAYLTISKRYASGDYHRAINGYWSPWSCWLTALLIKAGLAAIPASVVINSIGAAGFLFISQSFFLKFNIERKLQWLFNFTLAFFLCYAVFWQSFDDLWECFFLLSTLRIMLSDGFSAKPTMWLATGFIGALAYFAKAYSFPFFILNTISCCYFIDKNQWLKISATSIAVMIVCSLPWIWLLHNKYGIWTTSTAGTLNTSWYLVGHPQWKEGIGALLPPPYPDSPSYWEDPWFVNGARPHFWNSWHLFGLQMLRIGYNFYKYLNSMNELSIFFAAVWLISLGIVFMKKVRAYFPSQIRLMALSLSLFPLGFFLVNFEGRYIWYMLPLSIVVGIITLQNIATALNKRWLAGILYVVFAVSFLFYPLMRLHEMRDKGRYEYKVAECLKNHNITGPFTAEASAKDRQEAQRIAYFSGNAYYNVPQLYVPNDTLMQEIYRYHIKYCFFYPYSYRREGDVVFTVDDPMLHDANGKPLTVFTNDSIYGMKIFRVYP